MGAQLFLAVLLWPAVIFASALDVNDVSILFPLKEKVPVPRLDLQADNLLSEKLFKQVLTFETPSKNLDDIPYLDAAYLEKKENWLITSFRYDPCGDVFQLSDEIDIVNNEKIVLIGKSVGCQPRLRLVAQPFNAFSHPLPTGIHLLYDLSPEEGRKFVAELVKLKQLAKSKFNIETTGLPLMTHPALVEVIKTDDSEYSEKLKSVLLQALVHPQGPSARLSVVTLNVQSTFNHWRLVGGRVRDGEWRRFVTEFSKKFNAGEDKEILTGLEVLACDLNPICTIQPSLQPDKTTVGGIYITQIFQNIVEMQRLQIPGFRNDEIHQTSELIDNPKQVHFFNTNCVSCHQSANLRDYEKIHTDLAHPEGITPFVPKKFLNQQVNTVINFGYQGLSARISTRTAAESAHVSDQINKSLGLQNAAPKRELQMFWQCLVSELDFKKCL